MSDKYLLREEEIEKVVAEWVNEDYCTRSVQLDRGHWEYIASVIAQAQLDKATPDIEAKERERILDAVSNELWKIRQMFDYDGNPTEDESECTESNLSISSPRWAELRQALGGGKG